jgi:hypothetical protein
MSSSKIDKERRELIGKTLVAAGMIISYKSVAGASILAGSGEEVDVLITVEWENKVKEDGSKEVVSDVRVFDHAPNTLLGKTDKNGEIHVRAKNGTTLRLVEPKYGEQQALILVSGRRRTPDLNIPGNGELVMDYAEGWTI